MTRPRTRHPDDASASLYWSGWMDALTELDRRVEDHGGGCLDCELDAVRFKGIALATEAAENAATWGTQRTTPPTLAGDVAEVLISTALAPTDDDAAKLMGLCRHLVTTEPDTATQTLAVLVLLASRRYPKRADTGPGDLVPVDPDHWHG